MNILIAEDDDVSRMLLTDILRTDADNVIHAVADGEAAWSALQEQGPFDLAIFDVMMPGLSGLDLLARVRSDRRFTGLPVIMCTALNDRTTVTSAAALVIEHYIVKPFSRKVVLDKVRSVAAGQAAVDALEPGEQVCSRLGLDDATWRAMLSRTADSVSTWISDLQQLLRTEQLKPLALRANALAGACINLGATGLAAQLSAAETALSTLEPDAIVPHDALICDPFLLSELTSIADNVSREAKRFRRALEALGKS